MDINEMQSSRVAHLERAHKRTVRLCKLIWEYREYIQGIKDLLYLEDLPGASELLNELDYEVSQLLMTAPRYGGPFETWERAELKKVWDVSIEDLERVRGK